MTCRLLDKEESPRSLSTQQSILESKGNEVLVSKIQDLKQLMKKNSELLDSTQDFIEKKNSKKRREQSLERMHSEELNSIGKKIIEQIYEPKTFRFEICKNQSFKRETINFKNRSRSVLNRKSRNCFGTNNQWKSTSE